MWIWLNFLRSNWKIALIVTALVASFLFGWRLKDSYCQEEKNDELSEYILQYNELQGIAKQLEEELLGYREHEKNYREELDKELRASVYDECIIPATGVRLLNKAITTTATSKPSDPM